jgi:molybdopterin-binding protein
MKLTLSLLLFVTVTLNVFSQSPEKMSYQAIIRAQDNSLVTNSNISLKIIVHQGAVNGTKVYEETHYVKSNNNGLVSLEIGTGTILTGSFSSIAWQNGPYFIETQVDVAGGNNFNIIGATQLLSVPYALHAKTADRLVGVNPYKSTVVPFISSRNIAITDINNIIECTTSATLTLTSGFGTMAVGDVIYLEAHNGAVLTIQASTGVTINYNSNSSALFSSAVGNVKFGLLRKTGINSYIISGQ